MKHAENNKKKKVLMSVERADSRNQKLLFQSVEPNYRLLETKNF